VTRYEKRLSGPILDRIDLHLSIPRVELAKLASPETAEGSEAVRARVLAARERQWQRLASNGTGRNGDVRCNADLRLVDLRTWCLPEPNVANLLRSAVEQLGLSARAYHRVLRVARTIADLAGAERVGEDEVAEAIRYRDEAGR
jgi:magnesium chelatase family protein